MLVPALGVLVAVLVIALCVSRSYYADNLRWTESRLKERIRERDNVIEQLACERERYRDLRNGINALTLQVSGR